MSYKILAINPGSTSTKIAVYTDDKPDFTLSLDHTPEELAQFDQVVDQFDWRKELIEKALAEKGVDLRSLDAVIGRGGIISPIESGVYEVNDDLRHDLLHARMQHASNLGGLIARDIADEIGVKSYIADPVVVDEMMPYARISGVPELPRESVFHALNQKAVARLFAKESNKRYEDLNLIVCHMGGGITVSAHRRGRVIDTTNALDGCGPFSPERSGSLPPGPLVRLCFSGKYTEDELIKMVHGAGGLYAHLGTTSVPEVLDRILNHDLHAMLILRAMCYTICKEIGAMATALKGDVDAILLTGGIAHSKRVTDFIARPRRLYRANLCISGRKRAAGPGRECPGCIARRAHAQRLREHGQRRPVANQRRGTSVEAARLAPIGNHASERHNADDGNTPLPAQMGYE